MSDKRYQVFVSSTFQDLQEERSEVMQALLELDCIPAGMELFPSANEEQWNWIRKVIDESDYYLVILANRYGSKSEATGQSYTEMEYRYAMDVGKPIIAFLHEDPSSIETKKSEPSKRGQKQLEDFRSLCKSRLVKYWASPADLGAKVSRSLTQLMKHQPAVGWVRADKIPQDQSSEILRLRDEIQQLKEEHAAELSIPENLASGNDELTIGFYYETKKSKKGKNDQLYWVKDAEHESEIQVTWDLLFAHLAPELINVSSEYRVTNRLNNFIESFAEPTLQKKHKSKRLDQFKIFSNEYDKIMIQLRALGLIEIFEDRDWFLTKRGDRHMVQLRAQKKAEPSDGHGAAQP